MKSDAEIQSGQLFGLQRDVEVIRERLKALTKDFINERGLTDTRTKNLCRYHDELDERISKLENQLVPDPPTQQVAEPTVSGKEKYTPFDLWWAQNFEPDYHEADKRLTQRAWEAGAANERRSTALERVFEFGEFQQALEDKRELQARIDETLAIIKPEHAACDARFCLYPKVIALLGGKECG